MNDETRGADMVAYADEQRELRRLRYAVSDAQALVRRGRWALTVTSAALSASVTGLVLVGVVSNWSAFERGQTTLMDVLTAGLILLAGCSGYALLDTLQRMPVRRERLRAALDDVQYAQDKRGES